MCQVPLWALAGSRGWSPSCGNIHWEGGMDGVSPASRPGTHHSLYVSCPPPTAPPCLPTLTAGPRHGSPPASAHPGRPPQVVLGRQRAARGTVGLRPGSSPSRGVEGCPEEGSSKGLGSSPQFPSGSMRAGSPSGLSRHVGFQFQIYNSEAKQDPGKHERRNGKPGLTLVSHFSFLSQPAPSAAGSHVKRHPNRPILRLSQASIPQHLLLCLPSL